MHGIWLLLLLCRCQQPQGYIESLLDEYNSTGLAVAVVQKLPPTANSSIPNWKIEYGSIEPGKRLGWWTKMKDIIPEEWVIQDKDIEQGATIQDLLSHRTGMPRHDLSWSGVRNTTQVIRSLRYLRSSATFRQTFQYNNFMYTTLSYLPTLFLNQTYESYIQQHLFDPLNMTSTTFSVERAEGELGHQLAEGHVQHLRDVTREKKGWLKPTVPYYLRPGDAKELAGAGGVISSARDMSIWMAMLLNDGRHPYTNEVVVPSDVLEFVSTGLVATQGKPEFHETSVKVYGAGQWRYSYQGVDMIEHGGHLPGFISQVARFPGSPKSVGVEEGSGTKNHGLGIITLSNDGEMGRLMAEAPKFRNCRGCFGTEGGCLQLTLRTLGKKRFDHPAYGRLVPCLVPESMAGLSPLNTGNAEQQSPLLAVTRFENPHTNCTHVLSLPSSKRVLENSPLDRPTYIIQWEERTISNVQRLTHFDANLFNSSVALSNADIRRQEGYSVGLGEDEGDILIDLDQSFEVEWVNPRDFASSTGGKEEGLSFRGNFWGKAGPHSEAPPEGLGKESAEVWFTSSSQL
ncbi:beta-lactamase/transpeptidase-like protein [Coprinopsis sp. MPI-PUGE-AT-0042]|nr:beta-lactamase/transpeptidase-like protein [Coprinopsis sp. MPI-PUGE-AT-0042]